MSDLIERSAVIDLIDKYTQDMSTDYWTANYGIPSGVFEDEIMDLPSAQPEQRWIPCSERLPEKDGRYQVTRYDYVANTEFIDILWYEENLWWNRHSTGDYAVTAWMPLPEPCKEGDTK